MSPDPDSFSTMWSLADCSFKLENADVEELGQDVKKTEHLQQILDTITSGGTKVEENSLLLDLSADTIDSSSISDCVIDPSSTTPSASSSPTCLTFPSLSSNSVVFFDNLSEEKLSAVNAVDTLTEFIPFASSSKELDMPSSLQKVLSSCLNMSELADNERLVPSFESLACPSELSPPRAPCFQSEGALNPLENPKSDHLQVSLPLLTTFNNPKDPLAHGPFCVTPDELSINGIVAQESIGNSSLGGYLKTTLTLTDCSDLLGSSRQHHLPPPLQGNLPLHVLQGSGNLPTMQRCHSSNVLDACKHFSLSHSSSNDDYLLLSLPSILYGEHGEPKIPVFERTSLYNPGDLKDLNLDGIDMLSEGQQSSTAQDFCQYTKEEKEKRIDRYRQKRNERNFNKKIKYACRKTLADSRPRIKGRFARSEET